MNFAGPRNLKSYIFIALVVAACLMALLPLQPVAAQCSGSHSGPSVHSGSGTGGNHGGCAGGNQGSGANQGPGGSGGNQGPGCSGGNQGSGGSGTNQGPGCSGGNQGSGPSCANSGASCWGGPVQGKPVAPGSIRELNANYQTYQGQLVTLTGQIANQCPGGGWLDIQDSTGKVRVDLHPSGFVIPQMKGASVKVFARVEAGSPFKLVGVRVEK